MTPVRTSLVLTLAFAAGLAPSSARANSCDTCSGTSCTNNGICVSGIPEPMAGRCTDPCPNPTAPFGGCPTNFTCQPLNNGMSACLPRSGDCLNLTNWTPTVFGQMCTTPSCSSGLECIGICTEPCTGAVNAMGSCPSGYLCGSFIDAAMATVRFCAPPVGEGQDCSGLKACSVGPCVNTGAATLCYRDCSANPTICRSGQICATYMLTGGGSVSVCDVPPPDGGVSEDAAFSDDTGVFFPPDTGVRHDSGVPRRDSGFFFPDAGAMFPDFGFPHFDANQGFADALEGSDSGNPLPGDDAGADHDAGTTAQADTGVSPGPRRGGGGGTVRPSSGCECVTPSETPTGSLLAAYGFAAAVLLVARRRRSESPA